MQFWICVDILIFKSLKYIYILNIYINNGVGAINVVIGGKYIETQIQPIKIRKTCIQHIQG